MKFSIVEFLLGMISGWFIYWLFVNPFIIEYNKKRGRNSANKIHKIKMKSGKSLKAWEIIAHNFNCTKPHPLSIDGLKDESKEELIEFMNRIFERYLYTFPKNLDSKRKFKMIISIIQSQPDCIFCGMPIQDDEGACKRCANQALEDLIKKKK